MVAINTILLLVLLSAHRKLTITFDELDVTVVSDKVYEMMVACDYHKDFCIVVAIGSVAFQRELALAALVTISVVLALVHSALTIKYLKGQVS